LNPAVTFPSQFVNWMMKGGSMTYSYMLIVGPILGGALGGFFFKKVLEPLCAVAKYELKYKR
jgi:glycerol uptake facilitator-like aquaporin